MQDNKDIGALFYNNSDASGANKKRNKSECAMSFYKKNWVRVTIFLSMLPLCQHISAAEILLDHDINSLTTKIEKFIPGEYATCRKITKSEFELLMRTSIEGLRSKAEQDKKSERYARLSLDRLTSAACARRVQIYLLTYSLAVDDLSSTAIKELAGFLSLSSDAFYKDASRQLVRRSEFVVNEKDEWKETYLKLVDSPTDDCAASATTLDGVFSRLRLRTNDPDSCIHHAVDATPNSKTTNSQTGATGGPASFGHWEGSNNSDVVKSPGPVAASQMPGPTETTPKFSRFDTSPAGRVYFVRANDPEGPNLRSDVPQPNSALYYSKASIKKGLQGVYKVVVCVTETGTTGELELFSSEGSPELESQALKYIGDLKWKPAVKDGAPVNACTAVVAKFQLKKK